MSMFSTGLRSNLREAILQTVAYADVFDYPLTSVEIHRYLTGQRAQPQDVERVLREGAFLPASDGFYTLPDREDLIAVRRRREKIAARMWPHALRYGRLIASLPFVRMVAITGSLAMNNVEYNPDIDYFLVTARGRLWTVRALVLALARVAAVQGARLCPNYLVTEDTLVFPQQTLYAAHELAQMVPLFGLDVYERILQLNPWKAHFLPNAQGLPPSMSSIAPIIRNPALASLSERALRVGPAEWFERWEMQRKVRRLSQEQSDSPESYFAADYCKGHNLQHGQRTERVLHERLEKLQMGSALLAETVPEGMARE